MKKDPNFKVCKTKILKIAPHPNPVVERLLIATVYGFEVVIGKNSGYNVGQDVIYFPENSVLPAKIENYLFPIDAKIKLTKARIRACRIQKFVSQGMIAPFSEIATLCNLGEVASDTDLSDLLDVVKYYPPSFVANQPKEQKDQKVRNKPKTNHYFKEYNGCTNIKWEPHAFTEDNVVWISEKIHGSNWRAGYLPNEPTTFKGKLFKFLRLTSAYEFCYGSNTVQRQKKTKSPTWYGADIYAEMAHKYKIKEKLKDYPGYVLYGEIYGPGVQKGYHYGLEEGQRDLVIFDVLVQSKKDQNWLSRKNAEDFCAKLGLKFVPVLYEGPWNKEIAEGFVGGNSVFAPTQKVREGIVVKNDDILTLHRKKIKIINPEYTMKEANDETTDHQEIEGEVEVLDLNDDFYLI